VPPVRSAPSKHHEVFTTLLREIRSGRWKEGERLPSEAMLIERFGHSRITIARALHDLQAAGVISRRAGSGSFVSRPKEDGSGRSFGLLIADLGETDIYESICRGMMSSPLATEHALVRGSVPFEMAPGNPDQRDDRAWQLCRQYIDRRVDGVFFAPLSGSAVAGDVNHRIVRALDDAGIPVVLLDRPVTPYPDPGYHDLVGIDNRRAGYVMTEHLLQRGARRIVFVRQSNSAPTVDARESGYRQAMNARQIPLDQTHAIRLDPGNAAEVRRMLRTYEPDGIVCANDRTAGRLMHTLRPLGVRIPADVRMVGIDDVEYASLLPVPLTTYRQPTFQIGEVALSMMLTRVEQRDLPARDTRLRCELIVRESCGPAA
jgi:DNA-binding LacI/PurR family transcriptional regulator/DNA-binding transcriptional regulator YhcF (GntR family)